VPDWIETALTQTETLRSPRAFRLWTAIATIAAALERRVWTETDVKPLYPNLYTVLAGGPASGKTIMVNMCKELLAGLVKPNGIFLGPDNPSAASFMDTLAASSKVSINGMGIPFYSAMTVACTELGDLMSKYDKDFVAKLTTLYDNPANYSMPRRVSTSLNIEAPCINLLAGATPDALGDTIPESAWGQGFTSRLVFVFGTIPKMDRQIFNKRRNVDMTWLKTTLMSFFDDLHGEFIWDADAQAAMERWFNIEKMRPIPTYGRLVNYNGRRDVHVMKLAMVSAVSAGRGLNVALDDFRRAQTWLFEAENEMPNVFRAMAQKSDTQLLQDCHHWLYMKYNRMRPDERAPIDEREIWAWFEPKASTDRIDGLIKAMERTGRMRAALVSGRYIPNPLDPNAPDEVEHNLDPELKDVPTPEERPEA